MARSTRSSVRRTAATKSKTGGCSTAAGATSSTMMMAGKGGSAGESEGEGEDRRMSFESSTTATDLSGFRATPWTGPSMSSLVSEFDQEVEQRCQVLRSQSSSLALQLRNTLKIELMKIPQKIRKMPLKHFVQEYSGDINAVLLEDVKKLSNILKTPKSTVKRRARVEDNALNATRQSIASARTFGVSASTAGKSTARRTFSIRASKASFAIAPRSTVNFGGAFDRARTGNEENEVDLFSSSVPETPAAKSAPKVKATPARPAAANEALFYSKNGSPILAQSVRATVRTTSKTAGKTDAKATPAVKGGSTARRRATRKSTMLASAVANHAVESLVVDDLNLNSPTVQATLTEEGRAAAVHKLQNLQDQVAALMSQLAS